MGGIGGPELLLVFLVVLLVFGPKKIPEVARGLGKGLREMRRLSTELQREIHLAETDEEREKRLGGKKTPDPGAAGPASAARRGGASEKGEVPAGERESGGEKGEAPADPGEDRGAGRPPNQAPPT